MKNNLTKIFTILTILIATFVTAIPAASAQQDARPVVYLTFDDGPSVNTPAYLDLLAEYDAYATFFMIGPSIDYRPAIAQRVVDEGHAVANHTWTHANLASSSASKIRSEFSLSQAAFDRVLGFTPTCFRPPYGATDAQVYSIQQEFGLTNADWAPRNPNAYQVQSVSPHAGTWDIDTNDWRRDPARVATELARVQGGDVVLMHDLHTTSLTPLRNFLAANQNKFRFEALPGCGATSENTPDTQGLSTPNVKCNGETPTIYGTNGDDVIVGTDGVDVIVGLQGNDTINGLSGNDIICGNQGNDTINGGPGNDIINGNLQDDTINGGNGNDILRGGSGNDTIQGGNGEDTIVGNQGNDVLNGGNHADRILGGMHHDIINGNNGNDALYGNQGNDTINGGFGHDFIRGNKGADKLYGNEGNDEVRGNPGNDTIYGGDAEADGAFDILQGGYGTDNCFETSHANSQVAHCETLNGAPFNS